MRRRGAIAVMLAALAAGLVGCASAQTRVDADEPTAVVKVGEEVVVDLGEVNSSVGTEWVLVEEPDPAVLGGEDVDFVSDQPNPPPGSSSNMTVTFDAVGAGETTLTYEYRFRGEASKDRGPLTFTITVR
ncbi:MAG TPA: protease inhibitor I42 family protein [Microbacterium sp.]|nr:protease inhibitor I42 family protein [Microbacterium sp.]